MSMYSCLCIIRLEGNSISEVEDTIREYLDESDYLTHLCYIVEEK